MDNIDQIDEKSIVNLILMFWKNRLLLGTLVIIFTIFSIVVTVYLKPKYLTTSKIIASTSNQNGSDALAQMAAMAGLNLGGANNSNPADYLQEIVKDSDFLKNIITKSWTYKGSKCYLGDLWKIEKDTFTIIGKIKYERVMIDKLRKEKYIVLTKDIKSGLITITTLFEDPNLSFEINNYVLDLLQQYITNNLKTQAKEKRVFIEKRIEETSKLLEISENNLAKFKSRNYNIQTPDVLVEEQRLLRVVSINQELYLQLKKQYELVSIQEKNDQPVIDIIRHAELSIYKAKPEKAKIILMGIICGLFFGVIICQVKDRIVNFKKG